VLVLPGKVPRRGRHTDRLRTTAGAPEALHRGRRLDLGEDAGLSTWGRGGEQWIHRSRWRTDGSDYHSILRERRREAVRPSKGEINGGKERGRE